MTDDKKSKDKLPTTGAKILEVKMASKDKKEPKKNSNSESD